jgi:hypothetical protein
MLDGAKRKHRRLGVQILGVATCTTIESLTPCGLFLFLVEMHIVIKNLKV